MKASVNQCKDKIARANNFDSFRRAIRYTFNRELLPSETEFINKIIDEAMEEYADITAKEAWRASHAECDVERHHGDWVVVQGLTYEQWKEQQSKK